MYSIRSIVKGKLSSLIVIHFKIHFSVTQRISKLVRRTKNKSCQKKETFRRNLQNSFPLGKSSFFFLADVLNLNPNKVWGDVRRAAGMSAKVWAKIRPTFHWISPWFMPPKKDSGKIIILVGKKFSIIWRKMVLKSRTHIFYLQCLYNIANLKLAEFSHLNYRDHVTCNTKK